MFPYNLPTVPVQCGDRAAALVVGGDDDQRAVEVGRAVNFQLVGERVPGEPVAVALEEQDMQADVVTSWMRNFAI